MCWEETMMNRASVCLVLVTVTGGCIDLDPQLDPTRFYVLPEPAPIESRGTLKTLKVGLLSVEVPDYLKSSKMVVRMGESEITYSEFSRWAEDLDQGIARVLYAHLAIQLPQAEISRFPWPDRTELDYRVKIRLARFEGVGDGGVAVHAEWSVAAEGGEIVDSGDFRFDGKWNGTRYEKLVGELGVGLARLSGKIGLAILEVADSVE